MWEMEGGREGGKGGGKGGGKEEEGERNIEIKWRMQTDSGRTGLDVIFVRFVNIFRDDETVPTSESMDWPWLPLAPRFHVEWIYEIRSYSERQRGS